MIESARATVSVGVDQELLFGAVGGYDHAVYGVTNDEALYGGHGAVAALGAHGSSTPTSSTASSAPASTCISATACRWR